MDSVIIIIIISSTIYTITMARTSPPVKHNQRKQSMSQNQNQPTNHSKVITRIESFFSGKLLEFSKPETHQQELKENILCEYIFLYYAYYNIA